MLQTACTDRIMGMGATKELTEQYGHAVLKPPERREEQLRMPCAADFGGRKLKVFLIYPTSDRRMAYQCCSIRRCPG